jgi:uncharacterized repeat protein (TIGR03803 family)
MFVLGLSLSAVAQNFAVLHTFTGGSDGFTPYAGVSIDNAGNLYGTTTELANRGGTAFQMKRRNGGWIFNNLASYVYYLPGPIIPQGRIVAGPGGALYGTSNYGGIIPCTELGCGTVFALRAPQTFCRSVSCPWTTILEYQFNGIDGFEPGFVDPVFDSAGDMYGTTTGGGQSGAGNVFQLTRSNGQWTSTSLHDFAADGSEGRYPYSSVALDAQGNVYGTTLGYGPSDRGTVWRLTHSGSGWSLDILYSFPNDSDGSEPVGGLVFDHSGNLYGTTAVGGVNGGGTVFELSPSGGGWNFSVIYSFTGQVEQGTVPGPFDTLAIDASGSLYGTTYADGLNACGNVFKLARNGGNWNYTSLHDFSCGADGAYAIGGVSLDADGNLYGTASAGGNLNNCYQGCGVVWEITP